MKIKLLKDGYLNNDNLYNDYIANNIINNSEYISEYEEISLPDNLRPFPTYLAYANNTKRDHDMLKAFNILKEDYINIDREILYSERFWHSLYLTEFSDYINKKYSRILTEENIFKMIQLKPFNWENYIYKTLLATQYLVDNINENEQEDYLKIISNNMDLFNYILKYHVFRNEKFIINFLNIIKRNNLSNQLKAKIKHRDDLGRDERYGRRILLELNQRYPVEFFQSMELDQLENVILQILENYKK